MNLLKRIPLLISSLFLGVCPCCGGTNNGAFHVKPDGNDSNNGTSDSPFATLERGLEAARNSKTAKTVFVHGGNYTTDGIMLDSSDSGTTLAAFGDGEVTLNCGISVSGKDFVTPDEKFLSRLDADVRDKVKCVDLTSYGVTSELLGNLHAIGQYQTAGRYDGDYVGTNCEVFWNDRRMTLARYPSEGFLGLDGVIDVGDTQEYPPQDYHNDWYGRRNHRPGIYRVDAETAKHINKWSDIQSVWMFGYFYHDWADSSTPLISADAENGIVYPKFVSCYGAKEGAKYFFYNVAEELNTPGEYYIDRENCILYLYPTSDTESGEMLLTVRERDIISGDGVENFTVSGITVLGTRGNGISICGVGNRVENCTVKNVAGNAIILKGSENRAVGCEILHTGRGGIMLEGGDRASLTRGNNVAENNYIHDWSEVYLTYQSGISVYGVGNTVAHNELFNSPHMAIFFSGNDNTVEYNLIRNAVRLSNDAGAIYCGRDWTQQGNVVRYNIVKDLGSSEFTPCGIYLDDALSGTDVYGNLLYNAGGLPFLIGGGRDNRINGNIVINPGRGMEYDARARDGFLFDGWYRANVTDRQKSVMWVNLDAMPYKSEIWAKRYPALARIKDSFDTEPDDVDFPANPANVEICGNAFFCDEELNINDYIEKYCRVEDNLKRPHADAEGIFADPDNCDFRVVRTDVKLPEIPFDKIGRNR